MSDAQNLSRVLRRAATDMLDKLDKSAGGCSEAYTTGDIYAFAQEVDEEASRVARVGAEVERLREENGRLRNIAFDQAQAADTLDEYTMPDGRPRDEMSHEDLGTAIENARSFLTTHDELETAALSASNDNT
ncbi:MAG: hypothetical protein AAGF47_07045 [Planctomycetota bacterium]